MIIGFVGAPSSGKSSFFKAATLADAEIANYPFTTIKPNHGVGFVRIDCVDKDFGKQCNPRIGYCVNHQRFVAVDLMDVAGLVPGAHLGLGLGSQFLDDLRQAHVLIQVVDMAGATNEKGDPVAPLSHDPAINIRFLEVELDMWYLGILKKGWEKFARTIQQQKGELYKALGKQLSGLGVTEEMVNEAMKKLGLSTDPVAWVDKDLERLATHLRKQTKPMVIAANKIDIPGADNNYERIKKEFPEINILPCSAASELALREASKAGLIKYLPGDADFEIIAPEKLSEAQKKGLEYIRNNVMKAWKGTGVQQILNFAVFDLLKYIAIYPGGVNNLVDTKGNCLPDCFLMPPGSTSLDFAFKLHTDFGKNFIRAIDVKTKMTVGKEHKIKHRDVMEIVSR